jgi:putative N6-adenine-specific DNA methylase
LLAHELVDEIGLVPQQVAPQRGGVGVRATGREAADPEAALALALRLNLHSRLAQRVLLQLADAPYRDEQALYELARRPRWTDWLDARMTLRVDVTAQRSPLKSLHFAGLRVKDAVCDALRDASGARPDIDTRRPDLSLVLHLQAEHATLYADTSGEALFKRGWREDKGEAPLKETLAAAMLAAAGWRGRAGDGPLLDPCCGAGTIAIEAAQLACGIAPGLARRFALERWRPAQSASLRRQAADLREVARAAVHAPAAEVHAGDVAFRMTDFATRNAVRAGVEHAIAFKTADALQRLPPRPGGTLLMNPPYGERIGAKGQGAQPFEAGAAAREQAVVDDGVGDFFAALATHWKRHYAGWTAWVLSPDARLPQRMRLKESARVPLWNGPIECRLFRFDLVAGSNRTPRGEAGASSDAPPAGPPAPDARTS